MLETPTAIAGLALVGLATVCLLLAIAVIRCYRLVRLLRKTTTKVVCSYKSVQKYEGKQKHQQLVKEGVAFGDAFERCSW